MGTSNSLDGTDVGHSRTAFAKKRDTRSYFRIDDSVSLAVDLGGGGLFHGILAERSS